MKGTRKLKNENDVFQSISSLIIFYYWYVYFTINKLTQFFALYLLEFS